jgi:cytochrome P450/NADPH-cytochrome P450 reductase
MPYLQAVMREAMRLQPTAPIRGVEPLEDATLGGGKYFVKKGQTMLVMTSIFQRDPKVWGEDVCTTLV